MDLGHACASWLISEIQFPVFDITPITSLIGWISGHPVHGLFLLDFIQLLFSIYQL